MSSFDSAMFVLLCLHRLKEEVKECMKRVTVALADLAKRQVDSHLTKSCLS